MRSCRLLPPPEPGTQGRNRFPVARRFCKQEKGHSRRGTVCFRSVIKTYTVLKRDPKNPVSIIWTVLRKGLTQRGTVWSHSLPKRAQTVLEREPTPDTTDLIWPRTTSWQHYSSPCAGHIPHDYMMSGQSVVAGLELALCLKKDSSVPATSGTSDLVRP